MSYGDVASGVDIAAISVDTAFIGVDAFAIGSEAEYRALRRCAGV